jgi:antitoxin CcdA
MPSARTSKKPTNLSLDQRLLAEAKALDINLSQAAENGLRIAVGEVRAEQWKAENAAALDSSNQWVEANGLPLERYRRF